MFEGMKERQQKIANGYAAAKHRSRQVGIFALCAGVTVVAGPPLWRGLTDSERVSAPRPSEGPAGASAKAPAGPKPKVLGQVELAAQTKLYNQPNRTGGECAYIPKSEVVNQLGKVTKGMVLIATPAEGDGKWGQDNFVHIPGQDACNSSNVWVAAADVKPVTG
jgi:hypothetical protein